MFDQQGVIAMDDDGSNNARPLTRKQRRAAKREADAARYAKKVEQHICLRCGDRTGESLWCAACEPVIKARDAKAQRERRARLAASGVCVTCLLPKGRKTVISPVAISPSPARWHTDGKRNQVRQVTEGDGRTRNRGIGQARRGRMSRATEDEQDLSIARRELEQAIRALAYAHSPDVKQLPVKQREATMEAALARLHLTQRLIVEILHRHKYAV